MRLSRRLICSAAHNFVLLTAGLSCPFPRPLIVVFSPLALALLHSSPRLHAGRMLASPSYRHFLETFYSPSLIVANGLSANVRLLLAW